MEPQEEGRASDALELRDALERMGLTEEYLYSSSDKSLSREEFGKRLVEVLSDQI